MTADESQFGRLSLREAMESNSFKRLTAPVACAASMMALGCSREGAKLSRAQGDFQSINAALKIYVLNAGRPPSTEQGLEALVNRPTLAPLPEDWVQLATAVPTDPWKNPYQYRELPSKDGTFRWELRGGGPDGKLWTDDDRRHEGEWNARPQ